MFKPATVVCFWTGLCEVEVLRFVTAKIYIYIYIYIHILSCNDVLLIDKYQGFTNNGCL